MFSLAKKSTEYCRGGLWTALTRTFSTSCILLHEAAEFTAKFSQWISTRRGLWLGETLQQENTSQVEAVSGIHARPFFWNAWYLPKLVYFKNITTRERGRRDK